MKIRFMKSYDFLGPAMISTFSYCSWSFSENLMESSGFPYKMQDSMASGITPSAVFGDGKPGSQTAQKHLPWGVGGGEQEKIDTASTRDNHILLWK